MGWSGSYRGSSLVRGRAEIEDEESLRANEACQSVQSDESCFHNRCRLNVLIQYPKLPPHILQTHLSGIVKREEEMCAPLNFLSGIIESSNFSSSFMSTFFSLPSPTTTRVLPQLNSSIHQKE